MPDKKSNVGLTDDPRIVGFNMLSITSPDLEGEVLVVMLDGRPSLGWSRLFHAQVADNAHSLGVVDARIVGAAINLTGPIDRLRRLPRVVQEMARHASERRYAEMHAVRRQRATHMVGPLPLMYARPKSSASARYLGCWIFLNG